MAFLVLLWLHGDVPGNDDFDPRWIYGANVLIVGGLLVLWWREYGELAPGRPCPERAKPPWR